MAIVGYKVERIGNSDYRITVNNSYLFGLIKKTTQYESVGNFVNGFYRWVKKPNNTTVGNTYQLDLWVMMFKRG